MLKHLHPLNRMWEQFILRWARRELKPTHPVVPAIVRRLRDAERSPSPLDPADSLVTGACVVVAMLFLLFVALGWVK